MRNTRFAARFLVCLVILAGAAWGQLAISVGPNLGTYSIGVVQFTLTATGGSGPYSWSLAGGTLPPGIAIRTDLPAWMVSNATAGLFGVATTPGDYSFTLAVSSGGSSVQKFCTMRITALVPKELYRLPDAFQNVSYSYTFTALGAAGPVTWTASSGLPAGVLLSPDGVLSGLPGAAGNFNINVTASDGVDTVYHTYTLPVSTVQITCPGLLPNATQNSVYSYTCNASGGAGSYIWSSDGLPGGLTLNWANGTLSGTVTQGPGRYAFSMAVIDSNRVSYIKKMSIVVLGVPPVLPALSPYTTNGIFDDCTIGVPCSRSIGGVSGGVAPFTWNVSGLPPGMSYRSGSGVTSWGTAPNDVELWGTPAAIGNYNVQCTATDANGSTVRQTFPLRVVSLVVDGGDYLPSGTWKVPYSSNLRVLGGAGPYTAQLGAPLAAGLTLSGLTISGTPQEDGNTNPVFLFSDSASHSLQFSQGMNIAGGTFSLVINQSYNLGIVPVNSPWSFQLSACCASSYTWTQAGGVWPPGVTVSTSGLLNGTPTTAGTYTFLVQVADPANAASTGVRQFVLVVSPLVVSSAFALPYGNVGVPYTQNLTATGGTGALNWMVAPGSYLPPGLAVNSSTGVLSGTPTSSGFYSFRILVVDTGGNATNPYVNISIYPANAYPPLYLGAGPNLGPYIVGTVRVQLSATGGVPPYHYSLTPNATVVPGLRVQDGAPLPTSFPAGVTGGYIGVVTVPGIYSTSLRVTDSAQPANTFDRPVTVVVSPLAILNPGGLLKAVVGAPYSYQFTGYGGSGSYSWSATNRPAGLTMSTSGLLSGTPTAPGTFGSIQVTITDTVGSFSITNGFTLVVDPYAVATSLILPAGAINVAYSQTLSAPGCGDPCSWALAGGSLPQGLSLSSSGVISGTPPVWTLYNGSFTAQSSGPGGTVQTAFSLTINRTGPQPLNISNAGSLGYVPIGGTVVVPLGAQGGAPPYTWSLASGNLPPGVSLQGPGETLARNYNPGFTYLLGRSLLPGTYHFTLMVTDSASNTTTAAYTLYLTPLAFDNTNLPFSGNPLVFGSPYTQALLVLGGSGNYTSWMPTDLPFGLTIGMTGGVIFGTPMVTGNISTPLQVTDDAGNIIVQNVNFNIASATGVSININLGPDMGTISQGWTQFWPFGISGGTGPYTVTAVTVLPSGFAIEAGNTRYSGSGTYNIGGPALMAGTFRFTLMAQDSVGNIGARTMTLRVAPFTFSNNTTMADASVGTPYSEPLLAWDTAGVPVFNVAPFSALPPGLTLVGNFIQGVPTTAGDYSFAIRVSDAGLTQDFFCTMHVAGITIADPPILPQQALVGVPFSYTFTTIGGSGSKTWSATGLPHGLSMSSNGVISGTTDDNASNYTLTVTVTSGATSLTRTFGLFVRNANPPPLDYNQTKTQLADVLTGQSYVRYLSLSGGTPPYSWSVASGSSLPPGLNLYASLGQSSSPPGLWTLAGAPSTRGNYSFDLVAADSKGQQLRRTFTLNVTSMGLLPNAPIRNPTVGAAYTMQMTAVGGTPPYAFTYQMADPPFPQFPPGITGSSTGLISGTATSTGNFEFIVTVQDHSTPPQIYKSDISWNAHNSYGLNITSTDPWDQPVGIAFQLPLTTNDSDPYTWSLAPGSNPMPQGVMLAPASWWQGGASSTLLTGAPQTPGNYTFTLRASDTAYPANTMDRLFTFRVGPAQPLYQHNYLPPATLGVPYTFTFRMAGGAPPYTFTAPPESWIKLLPKGLSITSDGRLTGTPLESGTFYVVPYMQDNSGTTILAAPWSLYVLPAAATTPLIVPIGMSIADSSDALIFVGPEDLPLGSPALYRLGQLVEGGTPPYTWSVTGNAPPGMVVLPGSGAISAYAGGIASTAGTYNWNWVVTDSLGQTLTIPSQATVSPVTLSPLVLPPGRVGTAYSAALAISGGTAPYSVQLATWSGLPPGVAMSPAGVFSGTPLYSGVFHVVVTASDSANHTLTKNYVITIDDTLGQAPAVSLSPSAVKLTYVAGTPAPSAIPISIGTTTGTYPFTATVSGIPGASLSITGGTVPATVNLNLTPGSQLPGTYTGVIAVSAPLSANGSTAIPVVLTVTGGGFFAGATSIGNGFYYLQLPTGNPFGYYINMGGGWIWHSELGYVCVVAAPSGTGIFLWDLASGHWLFTDAANFPYLYDFNMNTWLYYFPDTNNPGHYLTNPRVFANLSTGQIFTM